MGDLKIGSVSGDSGNLTLSGAPGGNNVVSIDASGAATHAFEVVKDGVTYAHMAITPTIKGLGLFEGTYLALENTLTNMDPQLRIYNAPAYGFSVIKAYHSTSPTTKHALQVCASGKLFLFPTNGDDIEAKSRLKPDANGVRDLGASDCRWKTIYANDVDAGGLSIGAAAPASSDSPGYSGSIRWDGDYIYVCTAPDTWKRAPLSTW